MSIASSIFLSPGSTACHSVLLIWEPLEFSVIILQFSTQCSILHSKRDEAWTGAWLQLRMATVWNVCFTRNKCNYLEIIFLPKLRLVVNFVRKGIKESSPKYHCTIFLIYFGNKLFLRFKCLILLLLECLKQLHCRSALCSFWVQYSEMFWFHDRV